MPESSRSTIHEQAEEKSFDIDENLCKEAENILINPKKRLEAEISWFPGLDIKTVTERVKEVFSDTKKYISDLKEIDSIYLPQKTIKKKYKNELYF